MYPYLKRVLDVVLASLGLVFLAPFLAAIAAWIKLADPGPVFYTGVRVGKGGAPFRIIKYRTMIVEAEKVGPSSTAGDDPRITAPGRFLRRFKLDELAQLINVLRGDMSFVGPASSGAVGGGSVHARGAIASYGSAGNHGLCLSPVP
jgi:lipopolysaccharide/colanic/teichoic acid biosynthesis glycosyltransferase